MEAAPPPYEKAVAPQKWELIAPYLSSRDLCSAARVCQQWHSSFTPHIWGDPSSHFEDRFLFREDPSSHFEDRFLFREDRCYVNEALNKFRHVLPFTRLSVRTLTHTLHIPRIPDDSPREDWLIEILEKLPSLQSLIVRGLEIFDHACLNAVRYLPSSERPEDPLASAFGLRLLEASWTINATAKGLTWALERFPFMLYLDLSYTKAARDHAVLKSLRNMTGLQVLKLRGISLKDEDMQVLGRAISTGVRALDVRNNLLTDKGARALLKHCFQERVVSASSPEDSSMLRYLGAEMLEIYHGEQYESYLWTAFTTGFVDRLAIEDTPQSGMGITHLSISDNQITVDAAGGLIGKLHVLDIGLVRSGLAEMSIYSRGDDLETGAEMLAPVLAQMADPRLTFLRIDHRLITKEPSGYDASQREPESVEPEPPAYEPPTQSHRRSAPPGYEQSISNGDAPPYSLQDEAHLPPRPRYSSLYPRSTLEAPSSTSKTTPPSIHSTPSTQTTPPPHNRIPTTNSAFLHDRALRVKGHLESGRFHPGILPHLTTLVLTNIPLFTSTPEIADRIISFIQDCAYEAWLLPRTTFALREIVLEIARDDDISNAIARMKSGYTWGHRGGGSVTQDPDSDVLAAAAASDFSFFREDDPVHGLFRPEEPGRSVVPPMSGLNIGERGRHPPPVPLIIPAAPPLAGMSGLKIRGREPPPIPPHTPPSRSQKGGEKQRGEKESSSQPHRIDVVARIAAFRREKKGAYEAARARGERDPWVRGYWGGVVKVVRI